MRKQYLLIPIIYSIILCCFPLAVSATVFSDINGHWGESHIYYAADASLLHGYGDGTFRPDNKITRAEFTTILANDSGENMTLYTAKPDFNDISSTYWANQYIRWGMENGIILGYEDGTFRPNQNISREEVCTILYRYIKDYRKLPLKESTPAVTFADETAVGSWALTAVRAMQRSSIINGKGNNIFDPKANTTRAESAALISNYLKQYRFDDSNIYMTTDLYFNSQMKVRDVALIRVDDTIMVPIRALLTAASFRINYFSGSNLVVADNISHDLECKINEKTYYANGTKFSFSAAPSLQNGVTYAPLYEVCTRLGLSASFHHPGTAEQYLSITGSSSLLSLNVNNFYGTANTAATVNGTVFLAGSDQNSGFYGTLLNGAMSYGSYKTSGGDYYFGNWSNDLPNGAGRYISKNGELFVGIFTDGVKSTGTTYFVDGSRFEGSWSLNSNGTLSPSKGKLITAQGKTYGTENTSWSYGSLSKSNW